MKKKIVIHIEGLTISQEDLLQDLFHSLRVEQIEVLEDTTSTLLVGKLQIYVQRHQVNRIMYSVWTACAKATPWRNCCRFFPYKKHSRAISQSNIR